MHFIHFGCWNKGKCSTDGDNDVSRVMSALRKEHPDFLTVCGDNYYPSKQKVNGEKVKTLSLDDLRAGFHCLPNVPIHMVFGNHDYETGLFLDGVKEHKCTLTQTELDVAGKMENLQLHFFHVFSPEPNTLIMMLDTTVYDDADDGLDEYLPCYTVLDDSYTSGNVIRENQHKLLENAIAKYSPQQFKNIVIVGHHPIIHHKEKKGTLKQIRLSPEFENLLYDIVYSKFGENAKYTYLCADLHQYQCGDIVLKDTMKIRQHIVGTGGAEKDPYNIQAVERVPTFTKSGISYTMSPTDRQVSGMKNGYLKCKVGENGLLKCVFREVVTSGLSKSTIPKYSLKTRKTRSLSPHSSKNGLRKTKSHSMSRATKKSLHKNI